MSTILGFDWGIYFSLLFKGVKLEIIAAYMSIALLGVLLKFAVVDVPNSIKHDNRSINKFSRKHLFNWRAVFRFLITLFIMPIAIAHFSEFFGNTISVGKAFILGLSADTISKTGIDLSSLLGSIIKNK